MKRALSIENLYSQKFKTFEFDGEWLSLVGKPEISGSWLIWGNSSNGKTVFAAKLAKYMSNFGRVIYDSLEEGVSVSLKRAFEIAGIIDTDRIITLDKEPVSELLERLRKRKSPNIIIIDSFQYSGLTKESYKSILREFTNKLFIFISHAEGKQPSGRTARTVRYDAHVKIWIEGFKAIAKSRYGGDTPLVIWEKGAEIYWNRQ
jgi:predicted ATP-dependent serine protease